MSDMTTRECDRVDSFTPWYHEGSEWLSSYEKEPKQN
jgi:hypothetical protein